MNPGGVTKFLLAFIFFLLVANVPVHAASEVIYVNGKVVTVDDQFSIASGFATRGDRFIAVGTSEDIMRLANETSQVVDLEGRTVIPGLIDNHNHFIRGSMHWKNILRLDGVNSRVEALGRLQERADQLGEDEWLLVLGGWNEEQFADDPRGFTRAELDRIAGNRPAFLQAQYSHAFVNTALLNHIGVDVYKADDNPVSENTAINDMFGPPLSELVVRDEKGVATSRLNGGMGMVLQMSTVMPTINPEKALEGARSAQRYFNALGLTTIYDPAGALATRDAVEPIESLHRNKELSLRVFRTVQLSSVSEKEIKKALELRSLPTWLTKIILGFVADVESTSTSIDKLDDIQVLSSGDDFYDKLAIGEVLYVPMHDSMDSHDLESVFNQHRLDEVRNLFIALLSRGLPVQVHAVNPETIDAYLDIIEELSGQFSLYPNQITFTHVEGANERILRRMQSLGISVQIRSMLVVRSRAGIEQEFGVEALDMPPLRTIQDSGVTWGLGTDGTKASQIEPMRTLYWAVTGRGINGDQILNKDQLLSREEALIAHTKSNAILVNKANSLGQIRPGYLADFVVLDADYLSVDADRIPSIGVEMTVLAGKVVYMRAEASPSNKQF